MTVIEKVSYLKGLAEGLGLDESNKTDKLIQAIIDVLDDMALTVSDMEDHAAEIEEQVNEIDEDLGDLEEYVYGDEDDEDDAFYHVTCPECGEEICIDESMFDQDYINCPACGEKLEFDFGCDCDDEDCDCCGEQEK